MNQPDTHLSRDMVALRYLDAVEAGDLETLAAMWEEASRDAELERLLVEVDGGLLREDSVSRAEFRAERDTEDRVPAGRPRPLSSHWPRWKRGLRLAGALAAACLMIYLAWFAARSKITESKAPAIDTVRQHIPQPLTNADYSQAVAEAMRFPGSTQSTAFAWPLEMKTPVTVGTPVRPDLFN